MNLRTIVTAAIIFLVFFLRLNPASAQVRDTLTRIYYDDPVAAMLDSMVNLRVFEYLKKEKTRKSSGKFNFAPDSVPSYNDLILEARLAKLDAKSPFKLDYNESVRAYIDLYAKRKKDQVSRMLALSELYFPLFEEKLDKYDLPLELKYLAIVESALNANAKSRSGAMGLWQFMYPTGKMYGLRVDSYIDERCDPVKATEAACKYLKFLHSMYNDWHLALAAYNAGPGTVNKAIRRSGGKNNYWDLRPFLPVETRGYVPAFIAVNYIMSHTEEHNIFPAGSLLHILQTDSVKLKNPTKFEQISKLLNIPIEDIRFLNPVYRYNLIPCTDDETSVLWLPKELATKFYLMEEEFYASNIPIVKEDVAKMILTSAPLDAGVKKTHVVKKGEHLSLIARKYNCTAEEIKTWNKLKNHQLLAGQKLVIYTPPSPGEAKISSAPATVNATSADNSAASVSNADKVVYYVVQAGDTLWKIAGKYQGVTVEELMRHNNIKDASGLKVGARLRIPV
jgi:membrane-bound lytic murein transglycosylase D